MNKCNVQKEAHKNNIRNECPLFPHGGVNITSPLPYDFKFRLSQTFFVLICYCTNVVNVNVLRQPEVETYLFQSVSQSVCL